MRLARKSFLSLWSFPNLYRDSGRSGGKGDGQELADALVIFNEHVLIFSDKHSAYSSHKDERIAWSRWYRSAVKESATQLVGALKWITRYPDRIFLDKSCTERFTFPLPSADVAKFHLIAVTRGSLEACKAYFNNESLGSLQIDMSLRGHDQHVEPFRIGHVLEEQFIHVLDELTLDVLMDELDTVTDFVRYLEKKESFLSSGSPLVVASGEEQLAAIYLTKMNADGQHDFVLPQEVGEKPPSVFYLAEGFWESYVVNPQRVAKKEADKISYNWDGLIEHFVTHGESGPDAEMALRLLASESRFSRRHLSEQLLSCMSMEMAPGSRYARIVGSAEDLHRVYVFLILDREVASTYEEYRELRRGLLYAFCCATRLRSPDAHYVIGFATERLGTRGATEDLWAMDVRPQFWTEERVQEAQRLREAFDIFNEGRTRMFTGNSQEFPDVPSSSTMRTSPAKRMQDRERERNLERLRKNKAKREAKSKDDPNKRQ